MACPHSEQETCDECKGTSREWEWEYVGEKRKKKRIIVTPQVAALRLRAKRGLKPSTSSDTAARVDVVADMMRRNKWNGEQYAALAKKWDLSVSRVQQIAAEASRKTAAEVTDVKQVTDTVATTLARNLHSADELAQKAIERVNQGNTAANKDARIMFQSVADLADTWTKVVGARAPEKHEHEHAHMITQFNALSEEQKIVWIDERIAKLQEAKSRLLMKGSIQTNGGYINEERLDTEPTGPGEDENGVGGGPWGDINNN